MFSPRKVHFTTLALFVGFVSQSPPGRAADIGTAFTYQGSLENGSGPVTDTCDFQFQLYDAAAGGNLKGTNPQAKPGVAVDAGVFTVNDLDFGASGIDGTARWLEIKVCCPSACAPTLLSPRVKLNPAPHALALPGLRTEQQPFGNPPNLIGGFAGNFSGNFWGNTISGGGEAGDENKTTSMFDTVGGGRGNQAGNAIGDLNGLFATVSGGAGNVAGAWGTTVGGGEVNKVYDRDGTIGGGQSNLAGIDDANIDNQAYATVSGGQTNHAFAAHATIGGGNQNTTYDNFNTISGGQDNQVGNGDGDQTNQQWASIGGGLGNAGVGDGSTIAGGIFNKAFEIGTTIGGGRENEAKGIASTIAGGRVNIADGFASAIGGGDSNNIYDARGTIGGGTFNQAGGDDGDPSTAESATVGGGWSCKAFAAYSTVGGGYGNWVRGDYSTIPGGNGNYVTGDYSFAAGYGAFAEYDGAFVWADSTSTGFAASGPNQFLILASGGVGVGTNAPLAQLHSVADGVFESPIFGEQTAATSDVAGVYGSHQVTDHYGIGVKGVSRYIGVEGQAVSDGTTPAVTYYGVYGSASGASATSANVGVYGTATGAGINWAGYFDGDVHVAGTLSKSFGTFKIDHPLDPENKYLYHSFVESPDVMNLYNGITVLDAEGKAAVELPDYFEALNRDFRYQLTPIGAPGPNLYIAEEVINNSFRIAGGKPGMKVSWTVTGVRQDAYMKAHPMVVEENKKPEDRGKYLQPELFGHTREMGIGPNPRSGKATSMKEQATRDSQRREEGVGR